MNDNQKDHDLLIELRADVRNLCIEVKELKDNIVSRIDYLEKEKMEKEEATALYNDHEDRIRNIERNKPAVLTGSIAGGTAGAGAIIYAIVEIIRNL